jgi:hypothetical protein
VYDPSKSIMAKRSGIFGDTIEAGKERILIYGKAGAGKSFLAAQWPKPLFLDIDKGENKFTASNKLPYMSYKDETQIFQNLSSDLRNAIAGKDMFDPEGGPFADRQTLVMDTVTKLNEMLYFQVIEDSEKNLDPADDKATYTEYNKLLRRHQIIGKLLKQLALSRNLAVIVLALDKLEGAEDEKLKREAAEAGMKSGFDRIVGMPDLVGAYRYKICAEFTDVWYLDYSGNPLKRTLWTVPHNGYFAKSRFALPASIEVPTEGAYEKLMGLMGRAAKSQA